MKPTIPLVLLALTAARLVAADPASMMPGEWTEYRYERQALIANTPALAAENKQLETDFQAQADKVEAAMIQANPDVAPILKKVTAAIRSDWSKADASLLTPAQWLTLRATRAQVLQANPDLYAANQALLVRQKSLDAKIDAALGQADPSLVPLLLKLKARDSHPAL